MVRQVPVPVVHLVDAMGQTEHLWGKERVVHQLMCEQRASGAVDPQLVTFRPCHLASVLARDGFRTRVIAEGSSPSPAASVAALARLLDGNRGASVLHSHGYRANIVAKALRLFGGARGVRIVSTCHGWVESDAKLRFYNALDRWSSFISDVTTVPDPAMLAALPQRARKAHVANGVPEFAGGTGASPLLRHSPGEFIAGTLGRVSTEKGIADLLAAARDCTDSEVVFAVAGVGELTPEVTAAAERVRYAGYVGASHAYLEELDVYVQASHSEGLSLALLEAMRAGKAIVATDVGATREAVSDRVSALLVPSHRPRQLLEAILELKNDPALAIRLGRAARLRYKSEFRMQHQHERFLQLYFKEEHS
jgi:glycosyltransferase involved in cell wall biosynthesis